MSTKEKLICSSSAWFLCIATGLAQNAPSAVWASVFLNTRVQKNWANITDIGYRTVSNDLSPYQFFFRTGMRYILNNNYNLGTGVAFFTTRISFDKNNHENGHEVRFWQDFNRTSTRKNKFILDHRIRTEERFFDATSTRTASFGFRFSYRILIGYQVIKKFTIHTGVELMENIKDQNIRTDQNRFVEQLSYRAGNGLIFNLMYIYINRPAYNQSVFNFVINKSIRLDERDKEKR